MFSYDCLPLALRYAALTTKNDREQRQQACTPRQCVVGCTSVTQLSAARVEKCSRNFAASIRSRKLPRKGISLAYHFDVSSLSPGCAGQRAGQNSITIYAVACDQYPFLIHVSFANLRAFKARLNDDLHDNDDLFLQEITCRAVPHARCSRSPKAAAPNHPAA